MSTKSYIVLQMLHWILITRSCRNIKTLCYESRPNRGTASWKTGPKWWGLSPMWPVQVYSPVCKRTRPQRRHRSARRSQVSVWAGETHRSDCRSRLCPAGPAVQLRRQKTPPRTRTPNTPWQPWRGMRHEQNSVSFFIPFLYGISPSNVVFNTIEMDLRNKRTKTWTLLWSTQTCGHGAGNPPVREEAGWTQNLGCWQ